MQAGASTTGEPKTPDAVQPATPANNDACKETTAVVFAYILIGLYFLVLFCVITGLIAGFVAVAISFYILNVLQSCMRTQTRYRDRTSDGRGSSAANSSNMAADFCIAIGWCLKIATHALHVVGVLLIYLAKLMLSFHEDDIACVASVKSVVDVVAENFLETDVKSAGPGSVITYVDA